MQKRPATLVSMLALFVLLLTVAACGGGGGNAPDAASLIKKAQTAIQNAKSYHFNLKVDNPGTGAGLIITTADGDILVPDKLKANATALISGVTAQVQLIAIGSIQYVNLLGSWQKTTGVLDPRTLTDSNTGIAGILGHMQNLSTPTDSSVNGTACWSINGKLDPKYLSAITNAIAPTGSLVDTTTCIGKTDNLPYQIRISGIAAQGDSSKTVRTFTLSKFGESLTIVAPI